MIEMGVKELSAHRGMVGTREARMNGIDNRNLSSIDAGLMKL